MNTIREFPVLGEQTYYEDVEVGQAIPTLEVRPTYPQLFFYSAAQYNAHRIHYDVEWARQEGHLDVVVHGKLQASLMGRCLTDWAGSLGRLRGLNTRHHASAYLGKDLQFTATVSALCGDGIVELDFAEICEGEKLMTGKAKVELPTRGGNVDG